MQKKLIAISLLFLLAAGAGAHTLQEGAENPANGGGKKEPAAKPAPTEKELETVKTCVETICPTKKKVLPYAARNIQVHASPEIGKLLAKEEFPPALGQLFKQLASQLKQDRKWKQKILEAAKAEKIEPFNDSSRAFLNWRYLSSKINLVVLSRNGEQTAIDAAATRENFKNAGFDDENSDWAVKTLQRMFDPATIQREFYQGPADTFLKTYLGTSEPREAAEKLVKQFDAMLATIGPESSALRQSIENIEAPAINRFRDRLKNAQPITEYELSLIPRIFNFVENQSKIFAADSPLRGEKLRYNIGSGPGFSRQEVVPKLMAQLDNRLEAERDQVEQCKRNFFTQVLLAPDKKQMQRLLKNIETAKGLVQERFLGRLSEKTRASLTARMEKIPFKLPTPKAEVERRFLEVMTGEVNGRLTLESFFDNLSPEEKSQYAHVYYDLSLLGQGEPAKPPICNKAMEMLFSDGLIVDRSIKLGAATAGMDTAGAVFTVAHEIAHYLGFLFRDGKSPEQGGRSEESFAKFRKSRECLRDLHPQDDQSTVAEQLGQGAPGYRIGKTTEEDFSDFVGGLTQTKEDKNPICDHLLASADGKWEPIFMSPRSAEDYHSGDLFRLIHLELMQERELSDSCKQAMKTGGYKPELQVCSLNEPAQNSAQ